MKQSEKKEIKLVGRELQVIVTTTYSYSADNIMQLLLSQKCRIEQMANNLGMGTETISEALEKGIEIPFDRKNHVKPCTHKNHGTFTLDMSEDPDVTCSICHTSFKLIDCEIEEIKQMLESNINIKDIINSILTYYLDIDNEQINYLINIDLDNVTKEDKDKLISFYKVAMSNFKSYSTSRDRNMQGNNPYTFNALNMLTSGGMMGNSFGPCMMQGQPYPSPKMDGFDYHPFMKGINSSSHGLTNDDIKKLKENLMNDDKKLDPIEKYKRICTHYENEKLALLPHPKKGDKTYWCEVCGEKFILIPFDWTEEIIMSDINNKCKNMQDYKIYVNNLIQSIKAYNPIISNNQINQLFDIYDNLNEHNIMQELKCHLIPEFISAKEIYRKSQENKKNNQK